MNMAKGLKEEILSLRKKGLSYNEIANSLNCSKGSVSFHCKKVGLTNIGLKKDELKFDEIEKVKEYYLNHSLKETAAYFNISFTTVKRYAKKERKPFLTSKEKKERNYHRVKSHRQKIKTKSIEYKGGKCEKCGYNKCEWALDFHHVNPKEKDFNIARYSTLSWEKIRLELDKCIMVCANCHREIHYEESLKKFNEEVDVQSSMIG